jgi:TPR repeat protein
MTKKVRKIFVHLPRNLVALFALTWSACSAQECDSFDEELNLARNDDEVAQYRIGRAFRYGTCVESDQTESLYWYMRAAENGSSDAIYAIGLAFETGIDLPKNLKVAMLFYSKAADLGHPQAIVKLVNWKISKFSSCDQADEIRRLADTVKGTGAELVIAYSRFEELLAQCR